RNSVRQDAEDERTVALVREVAGPGAERPAREDIGLPVGADLDSRNGVVCGQQLQGINGGVVMPVFKDVWRHNAADLRDFSAREAATALEPLVRIVGFRRTQTSENALPRLSGDSGERH